MLSITNVPCFGIYAAGVCHDATIEELMLGFSEYGQLHASLAHKRVRRVGVSAVLVNYTRYEDARAAIDAAKARKLVVTQCVLSASAHKNTEFIDAVLETMSQTGKLSFCLQDAKDVTAQVALSFPPKVADIEILLKLVPQHIVHDASNRQFHLIAAHTPESPAASGARRCSPPKTPAAPSPLRLSENARQQMGQNFDLLWNLVHSDEHFEILRKLFLQTWNTTMTTPWVDSDGIHPSVTAQQLRTALCFTDLPKPMLKPVHDWGDITILCQVLNIPLLRKTLSDAKTQHTKQATPLQLDLDVLVDENIFSSEEEQDKIMCYFYNSRWDAAFAILTVRSIRYIIAHRQGNSPGYSAAVTRCLCHLVLNTFDHLRCILQDPDSIKCASMPTVKEELPVALKQAPPAALKQDAPAALNAAPAAHMSQWGVSDVADLFGKLQLPIEAVESGQVDGGTLLFLYETQGEAVFTNSVAVGGFGITRLQFKAKLAPQLAKFKAAAQV